MAGMVEALEGRASFYDLLAALYFKPLSEEQIDAIALLDMSTYADVNDVFADGLNDIARTLAKRTTATRQELAVDFTGAFAGTSTWEGKCAVPYESVFTSEDGLMFQDSYHKVYRLFRTHRVERASGYDFPDDHLSFMCEFLSILSTRAADALRTGKRGEALANVELSQAFLQEHILTWFDDFEELALRLLSTRFYRGVLKVSKGFFQFDREVADDLIEELRDVSRDEPDDGGRAAL